MPHVSLTIYDYYICIIINFKEPPTQRIDPQKYIAPRWLTRKKKKRYPLVMMRSVLIFWG